MKSPTPPPPKGRAAGGSGAWSALTRRQKGFVGATTAVLVAAALVMIASSLHRPSVPEFLPSPVAPFAAGDTLVGPLEYTVDASNADEWRYFDFSSGSLLPNPEPDGWDLAFQRFNIVANGGEDFAGRGGIVDLGDVPFDSVRTVPEGGYVVSEVRSDTTNAATEDWYAYSFTSHLLTPEPRTFAVRTADGRYAKFRILSYYCPEATPGCLTFRYVYQGDGSRTMTRGAGPVDRRDRGAGRSGGEGEPAVLEDVRKSEEGRRPARPDGPARVIDPEEPEP